MQKYSALAWTLAGSEKLLDSLDPPVTSPLLISPGSRLFEHVSRYFGLLWGLQTSVSSAGRWTWFLLCSELYLETSVLGTGGHSTPIEVLRKPWE